MKIKQYLDFYLNFDRKLRSQVIKKLKAWIKPKLRDSGFTTGPIGNSEVLQLCVFLREVTNGKLTVLGFVQDGIIEDVFGGGCVTRDFKSFETKQLISILRLTKQVDKGRFSLR